MTARHRGLWLMVRAVGLFAIFCGLDLGFWREISIAGGVHLIAMAAANEVHRARLEEEADSR